MIHAQAYGGAAAAAEFDEGQQGAAYAFDFGGVFFVGVLEFLECAARVGEVAGVDAHFLNFFGSCKGGSRVEMNVGYQRNVAACGTQLAANLAQGTCMAHPLCGEAHYVGSGVGYSPALGCGCLYVECGCVGHRLQAQRMLTANLNIAHLYTYGVAALYQSGFQLVLNL